MGIHADDLMFQSLNRELCKRKISDNPEIVKNYKWRNINDELIKLKDMSYSHLINAIKFSRNDTYTARLLTIELNRRKNEKN
jgi:hypothetical protein